MKRLYLIVFTLITTISTAAHAMRYTRPIFLARSLQQYSAPATTAEFNKHYRPAISAFSSFKPKLSEPWVNVGYAGSIVLEAVTQPQEKSPKEYASIESLSLSDIQGLAHALEHAHLTDLTELARRIADNITQYTTTDLITLLLSAPDRPRLVLTKAISKKITHYSTLQIHALIKADRSEQTHLLIANALKNNYTYFTQRSFMGVKLYSSTEWRKNYLEMIGGLRFAQQRIALEPILQDIHQFNLFDVLSQTNEYNKKAVIEALCNSSQIRIQDYGNGRDLLRLLEETQRYNQTHIAHSLTQHISSYNEWHFYAFMKYCNEPAKEIVCKAIANDIRQHPTKYKNCKVDDFTRCCTPAQKVLVNSALNEARQKHTSSYPLYHYPGTIHQELSSKKN